MHKNKEEITLSKIRKHMETIAVMKNTPIPLIDINAVRDLLGYGSNGTIGAYVKQVKFEHHNSNLYDLYNFSNQFKSAIADEIKRFVENAKEVDSQKQTVLEGLNTELTNVNEQLEVENQSLKKEINANLQKADIYKDETKKVIYTIKQELVSAKEMIKKLENENNAIKIESRKDKDTIIELKFDTNSKEVKLQSVIQEYNEYKLKVEELNDCLKEKQHQIALNKQEIDHLKSFNNSIQVQNQKYQQENQRLSDTLNNLLLSKNILNDEQIINVKKNSTQKKSKKTSTVENNENQQNENMKK
ncbi:hypothetical protein SAMN05660420_02854 [Desulfuromusa kysingii]|uniref:Uncharacterized protein n=1 Tax=Desulfuromusa kysingii TaxID=37625 RepID=A0A1H4D5W3_9BACT|nr:hypothetical protein [Desulfuromusa kysingii]SEA68114.1 hypothetical protein SAMN05660420_02854 [Desulfuromusa kysingii]